MTDLDAVIARARAATVDRAAAERYVGELDRWARPAPPERRWGAWLAAGLAAAAVVVAVWVAGRGPHETLTPVRIGDRAAIVAAPGAAYRVVRVDPGATEVAIDHGTVTARLWRTDPPHRLALTGGGVTATATGTIYSLAVEAAGPVVHVIEGTVEVRAGEVVHAVPAGASWPVVAPAPDPAAGRALLALTPPPPPIVAEIDAGVDAHADPGLAIETEAAGESASDAGVDAPRTPVPAVPPEVPAIKDRWRTARLLRGQGRFAAALTECLAIAAAGDPMWSPIALVEAIRIELGPLAAPERSIALADRMIREWPGDALAAEARELRCRALRQLGRADECAPAP